MENRKAAIEEEGMAMFMDYKLDEHKQQIYFEKYLPANYKENRKKGEEVIKMRNNLIILTFMEIFSAIWGFSYFFLRRSMVYIIINSIAFLIAIMGVFSSIYLNELGLVLYTLLTTSLPGTFFFYQLLELSIQLINKDSTHKDGQLNDNTLMLIFSLPYLFDLICGLYAMLMLSKMVTFNKVMKDMWHNEEIARGLVSNEDIEKLIEKYDRETADRIYSERISKNLLGECVICMEHTREIIIKPCNDILLCTACSDKLKNSNMWMSLNCPKCRSKITGFEKCYT